MIELTLPTEALPDASYSSSPVAKSTFSQGLEIYVQGLFAWRIWLYIAFSEIRRRYRRTIIGPFWVTLSVAIFIASIGVIFPILWHAELKTYLPFFSSGYIIWTFVSCMVSDACGTFVDAGELIKQTSLPYAVYSNSVVARNVLVVLHHLIVYLIVMILFAVPIGLNTLFFIPGMFLLCFTSSWMCILFGIFASRYRDIRQVVMSLIQVSMFITPIFWEPAQLGTGRRAHLFIECNPLHHFIQIARAPMLNQPPTMSDWLVTGGICLLGWLLTLRLLGKYKKHIVFWL